MDLTPENFMKSVEEHGSINKAVTALGITRFRGQTLAREARTVAQTLGLDNRIKVPKLPTGDIEIEDLLAERVKRFDRKHEAFQARQLIRINVPDNRPIGLTFVGDPHIDDDGCDIRTLFHHAALIRDTEGMYGMNIGDNQNLWIGRLGKLYGHQGTTVNESWRLVEHFIKMVPWLALVKGNHDLWAGDGDPMDWITRDLGAVVGKYDVRIELAFPNGRTVRVWMRHDFAGSTQWNSLHGLMKTAKLGADFHILAGGHTHTAAYHTEHNSDTGRFFHALRCSGYKLMDDYAQSLGLKEQNQVPSAVAVIDPTAGTEAGLIHVILDVEEGSEFLSWKRQR